jgi:trans-aconitate 2-methyltransferase
MAGDERVLDVGCGDGHITAAIADQLPDGSILGIDPSPRMIAAADSFASPRARSPSGTCSEWTSGRVRRGGLVQRAALVQRQHGALARIRAALRDRSWALIQVVCAGRRPSLEAVAMPHLRPAALARALRRLRPPFVHVDPTRTRSWPRAPGSG